MKPPTFIQPTSGLACRALWPLSSCHELCWDLQLQVWPVAEQLTVFWPPSDHLVSLASQNLGTPSARPSHPSLPLWVASLCVAFSSWWGTFMSRGVSVAGPTIILSLWLAQSKAGNADSLCCLASWSGWSWKALGRPRAGRLEPANTEATATERVERWVIASTYPLKPNSRTVKDLEFVVPGSDWNRALWLAVCQSQRETGERVGHRACLDTHEGYSGWFHVFHDTQACAWVWRQGWGISMCFPRISCSFLDAVVPSPPSTVTTSQLQRDHCWWCINWHRI